MLTASAASSPASANLIINATMDPTLSSSAVAVIDSAIKFYQTTIFNPITVNIDFTNMNSGLGSSTTYEYSVPYTSYRAALVAGASTHNDFAALAHLPSTTNNPVNGTSSVNLKSANARAVGFTGATGGTFAGSGSPCSGAYSGDSCIGLNLAITNDTIGGVPGGYSLLSVVEHEIDEALGLGSELPNTTFLGGNPSPEDLFRYSAPGVRSYAVNNSCVSPPTAYFSIDGGVTNLDSFNNCSNGGDYGDWISYSPEQVQDAFGGSGTPMLTISSPEFTALDVLGYNVPEPGSIAITTIALFGLAAGRRRLR